MSSGDRLDLGGHKERQRKQLEEQRQQRQQQPPNWRDSSRIWDPDGSFKALVSSRKSKSNEVKQAGLIKQQAQQARLGSSLTQQQIADRIKRMNIIQQDIAVGTYNDPDKPYHRIPRWIEDGGE